MPPARVYLVDDDPDVLKATCRLLSSTGMAVVPFQSPTAFLESPRHPDAGCILLDLSMPELSGLDVQRELAARNTCLPVVFLTGKGDIRSCVEAMKHGAVDFLTKPVDADELIAAVNRALERSATLRRQEVVRTEVECSLSALTTREREVLSQVVAGRLNKQIALQLGTGEKTIKFHRGNLMKKLRVRSVAELVRLAEIGGINPS